MAELLYHMEKLKGLMIKYNNVIQRYHVQYLAQFDAMVLNDTIQVQYREHEHVCLQTVQHVLHSIRCETEFCSLTEVQKVPEKKKNIFL